MTLQLWLVLINPSYNLKIKLIAYIIGCFSPCHLFYMVNFSLGMAFFEKTTHSPGFNEAQDKLLKLDESTLMCKITWLV